MIEFHYRDGTSSKYFNQHTTICIFFQELENLGATTQLEELGDQTLPDGSKLPLPPVLLATLGTDPNKKTLLVYGHLDVQPASKV